MSRFVSLMYHNVCAAQRSGGWPGFADLSPSVTGYFVDRQTFSRHCSIISETGRCLGTSSVPSTAPEDSHGVSSPAIQITFDDGWRGTLDEAGPVLESHGLTAILFVTTDLIGHPYFADRHQLAAASPTFLIGAHGRTHRPLASLPEEDIHDELTGSKAALEDILGREVDHLSFPGGAFDRRVTRIAREVGYRRLFTSEIRVNNKSSADERIGRVAIKTQTTDAAIRRYVAGDLRRERLRMQALNTVKRFLGRRAYKTARSRLMAERCDQLEMTELYCQQGHS